MTDPVPPGTAPTNALHLATRDPLEALEGVPLFDAMASETPPHPLRAAWLRMVVVVVGVLERALDEIDDARVRALWHDGPRTRPRLGVHVAVLDATPAQPTSAIAPMLALVEELHGARQAQPLRLVGALHASGSMLGRTRLLQAAGLASTPDHTLGTGPSWASLRRRLDALEPSAEVLEPLLHGARGLLARMIEIAQALSSPDLDEHVVIQVLNGDAGQHEITWDPREIMAAIDAGVRTWAQYPYYAARYGARGRRFTRSDSAWLVKLADLSESARLDRLDWLGRLLATRGMPSLLLQAHLQHLHEALVEAVPERAARYAGLATASRTLHDRRLATLPEFDALAARVPPHETLGSLGPIVIGAVADERQGIEGAVTSMTSWLADPQRSSAAWVAAMREAIEHARRS